MSCANYQKLKLARLHVVGNLNYEVLQQELEICGRWLTEFLG